MTIKERKLIAVKLQIWFDKVNWLDNHTYHRDPIMKVIKRI
jgi:hypothetical protein